MFLPVPAVVFLPPDPLLFSGRLYLIRFYRTIRLPDKKRALEILDQGGFCVARASTANGLLVTRNVTGPGRPYGGKTVGFGGKLEPGTSGVVKR